MIEAGGGAAPRCYLSLASGWLATPPLLLSIARHRPSWRKHVMARYYSARDKTQRLDRDEGERPSIHGSADNDGTF